MSADRFALDTNIVIGYLNGDPQIVDKVNSLQRPFLPAVVLGELSFGALNSTKVDHNVARVESFAELCFILPVSATTARVFGKIKTDLLKAGRPIPENDIWIAAQCKEHNCHLITRDNHFTAIADLDITFW